MLKIIIILSTFLLSSIAFAENKQIEAFIHSELYQQLLDAAELRYASFTRESISYREQALSPNMGNWECHVASLYLLLLAEKSDLSEIDREMFLICILLHTNGIQGIDASQLQTNMHNLLQSIPEPISVTLCKNLIRFFKKKLSWYLLSDFLKLEETQIAYNKIASVYYGENFFAVWQACVTILSEHCYLGSSLHPTLRVDFVYTERIKDLPASDQLSIASGFYVLSTQCNRLPPVVLQDGRCSLHGKENCLHYVYSHFSHAIPVVRIVLTTNDKEIGEKLSRVDMIEILNENFYQHSRQIELAAFHDDDFFYRVLHFDAGLRSVVF